MVTRERTNGWVIEFTRFHGPNVVSCDIFAGHTRTPLIGAYLPPLTMEHLPYFEETLQIFKGMDPIVLGYFNMGLYDAQSSQCQLVADLLTELGIIYVVLHF